MSPGDGPRPPRMSWRERRPLAALFLAVAAAAAGLDLWTKAVAQGKLEDRPGRIEVVQGLLAYRYAENTGIIFGGLKGLGKVFFVLALVAAPVIVWIFFRLRRPTWTMTLALAFILGGTLGNLHDRAVHDAVRDFIYVYAIDWPIFNLADSFILVGTLILMLELILLEEKKKPKPGGPA